MSIPEPSRDSVPPAGWYPTGEVGFDGQPLERWWDGVQWTATVRPLGIGAGTGTNGPRLSSRAKSLIAAGAVVALAGGGIGTYFALHDSNPSTPASASSKSTPTPGPGNGGLGGRGGGLGGGGGGGGNGGGGLGGPTASPPPTITGGGGKTVSDPIDSLTIPVPGGWTAVSGSASGEGTWPALSTGPYTCPSGLAPTSGTSSAAKCTRAGVGFSTTSGSAAQAVATGAIPTLASNNYGNLASHTVVNQGAVTVAGRAGYQVTWSVVPSYTGPGGTVEVIAVPVPDHSGYFTLIDIGVDQNAQAPSLSSVNAQIIANITPSDTTGA
ncbi:MAG TPA: DUF2510 domain-containing protein [Actinocrinis sp.]|nr:DUF2510 domain-containing protein [Actinocrinis sp.]